VAIPGPGGVEQATDVVSGNFVAVGVSASHPFYGAFNFFLYNTTNTALTTTMGSSSASVVSGTGLGAGMTINSVNVPPGTIWATFSGTSGTLGFAPGYTNANVITGTDNAALFLGGSFSGTVQLERSFDGGYTWLVCGVGGGGTQAVFNAGTVVSVTGSEPERGMLYRANCTVYTSGTINYRLSTSGPAAMAWGLMP
jgi:hypothetical protein